MAEPGNMELRHINAVSTAWGPREAPGFARKGGATAWRF